MSGWTSVASILASTDPTIWTNWSNAQIATAMAWRRNATNARIRGNCSDDIFTHGNEAMRLIGILLFAVGAVGVIRGPDDPEVFQDWLFWLFCAATMAVGGLMVVWL